MKYTWRELCFLGLFIATSVGASLSLHWHFVLSEMQGKLLCCIYVLWLMALFYADREFLEFLPQGASRWLRCGLTASLLLGWGIILYYSLTAR